VHIILPAILGNGRIATQKVMTRAKVTSPKHSVSGCKTRQQKKQFETIPMKRFVKGNVFKRTRKENPTQAEEIKL
jgi:hypothetical protein